MFYSFFRRFFLSVKESATTHHISTAHAKLPAIFRYRIWIFLAVLTLCIVAIFGIKAKFSEKNGDAFQISEAHAMTLHTVSLEAIDLFNTDPSEKTEDHSLVDELKQKQRVTSWIAQRYRIADKASNLFVTTAYKTGLELELDPHLILAVMAVESRFNPYAESAVGAQGLMQVMAKVHADKFRAHGGIRYALDPVVNIKVGSKILKEYIKRKGSIELALKSYVGAAAMNHDSGYGAKVIAEYRKLKSVASGSHTHSLIHAKSRSRHTAHHKKTVVPL